MFDPELDNLFASLFNTLSEYFEIHSKFQMIDSWIITEVFKREKARFDVCLKLSKKMKIVKKESVPITALNKNTK